MSGLKNIIRQLATEGSSAGLLVGTVTARHDDRRTVDVEPINEGAPILEVNLQANQEGALGVVLFPREGSYVAVAMLSCYAAGVVVLTDDVESIEVNINDGTKLTITEAGVSLNVQDGITLDIDKNAAVFNGGDLGGLINIADLTGKINDLVGTVNSFISSFNSHSHTGTHGPTTPPVASFSDTAAQFKRGDYEDKTVKH
jgi:hypothetical protein